MAELQSHWLGESIVRLLMTLTILLGSGLSAPAELPVDSTVPRTTEELRRAIAAVLQATDTAGASIVLVSKDEVLWSSDFGLADRETNRPVTPETMFRAGSISKSFVALAVLKLQEEGKLSLEDPVKSLVGDVAVTNPWEATAPLQLVHLLEHTAGFDDISMREYLAVGPGMSLREALAFRPQTRTSRWPPGRFFSYSNAGAPLAAYAVERAAGMSFEDYVGQQFLAPLEMTTASFLLTDAVEKNLATGYRQDGETVDDYKHIIYRPAGSLNVTARELAHLAQFWLNRGMYRGVRVLTPESIDRMEAPTTSLAAKHGVQAGYGLANSSIFLDGHRFQGHEGSFTGYSAICRYSREHGVGYVVMVNTGDFGDALRIEAPVTAYVTRDWEKSSLPVLAPSKVQLERLAGYYEPCTPRMERLRFLIRLMGLRRLAIESDHLRAAGPGSARPKLMQVDAKGLFRLEGDSEASLAFVEEDKQLYLVSSSFALSNYRRVSAWLAWTEAAAVVVCFALMASVLAFALVWIPRKAFGRLPDDPHLSVRTLPLLAVVSFVVAAALFRYSMIHSENEILLGAPTLWSVSFCAATWLFAAATVAGLIQAIRARRWDVRRSVRWHSLAVSLANVFVLTYLAYWGMIGVRTWI